LLLLLLLLQALARGGKCGVGGGLPVVGAVVGRQVGRGVVEGAGARDPRHVPVCTCVRVPTHSFGQHAMACASCSLHVCITTHARGAHCARLARTRSQWWGVPIGCKLPWGCGCPTGGGGTARMHVPIKAAPTDSGRGYVFGRAPEKQKDSFFKARQRHLALLILINEHTRARTRVHMQGHTLWWCAHMRMAHMMIMRALAHTHTHTHTHTHGWAGAPEDGARLARRTCHTHMNALPR